MSRMLVLTNEEISFLQKKYVEEGYSLTWCGKQLKHSNNNSLKRAMIKAGFEIRNMSEAIRISPIVEQGNKNKRLYSVNDNYFSYESSNMAYILGFIAADGNVSYKSNRIQIQLSSIDSELLEKIQQEIGGSPVKIYTPSDGFERCRWECHSKQIKNDLSKYNIVPNKTYTFSFPNRLNKIFYKDFIRGYFDGDGSIYKDKNTFRLSLSSHTKDILTSIINYFEEEGIPPVNIYTDSRNSFINYYFRYQANSTRKIYNLFYSHEPALFLKRKKDKFDELIKK